METSMNTQRCCVIVRCQAQEAMGAEILARTLQPSNSSLWGLNQSRGVLFSCSEVLYGVVDDPERVSLGDRR